MNQEASVSVQEAAARLGISESHVHPLVRSGHLRFVPADEAPYEITIDAINTYHPPKPAREVSTVTDDPPERRHQQRASADGVRLTLIVQRRSLPSGKGRRRWGRRRDQIELSDVSWSGAAVKAPDNLELPLGATVSLDLNGALAWATVRNAQDLEGHIRYGLEFDDSNTSSRFFGEVLASGIEVPGSPDHV